MQRERRTIWSKVRMMLWALSAVASVACIREDFIDDPDAPDAPETAIQAGNYDLYFRVQYDAANPQTRVSGSSGNDSGTLEEGSHDEHEIGQNGNFVLLFFDNPGATGNEAYVLRDVLPLALQEEWSDSEDDTEIPNIPDNDQDKDIVEAIFRSRINVSPNDLPKKCLVILNGLPLYEKLIALRDEQATLKKVLEMEWSDYDNPRNIGRDGDRFVMTNSAYFTTKELQVATDLTELDLDQYLWVEGDDNTGKEVLRIYVERMVAKFTFSIEATQSGANGGRIDKEIRDGKDTYIFTPPTKDYKAGEAPYDEYKDLKTDEVLVFTGFDKDGIQKVAKRKWRARVTGWGVNALETSSYVFKNVSEEMGSYNFGSGWSWRDDFNYRTYWAQDPHYSKSYVEGKEYPWQYRDAIDRSHPDWKELMPRNYEACENPILQNKPYDFFSRDMDMDRTVYAPENTYDFYAGKNDEIYEAKLDNREHLLAGTHVVVCAELEISADEAGNDYQKFTGYRDRVGTYYWGKYDPDGSGTETWESMEMAPYDEGTYERLNNTRNCFIRLMRTFNYYLGSQQEMYYVYYDWADSAIGSGTITSTDPNLGLSFYAKPRTTNKSHGGIYDDEENIYEICWEQVEGDPSTVRRVFNDANEYQLDRYDDDFKFFDMAYVKDGDGKVLPWVDGLRIYNISNLDENTGRFEVAKIPVHDKSNAQLAEIVQDYVDKLKKLVERMLKGDDSIDLEEEARAGNWDLRWARKTTDLNWSWVTDNAQEEVFLALRREQYEQALLEGAYPDMLDVHEVKVNDRRSLLLDWLNTVDYFADGMMYYAAEVKNPAAPSKDPADYVTDYDNSPYGVVRNNWYQFNLTGINSVGTSIADHKECIVPNRVTTNDQMTFNVVVLDWMPVPMGSITLPN